MGKLSELESKIRDLINNPRQQYKLLKNLIAWNQLCSSLDAIGDTELAIDAYINSKFPDDEGSKYLVVYGVLQSLFLQQDAIKHMAEVLNIKYVSDPLLKHIRDIRNKSIGHPTKKENGGTVSSHFISRITINKNGFTLMSSSDESSGPQFTDIDIIKLINNQRQVHTNILGKIIEKLVEDEQMHKDKFKKEKLFDIIPQTLDYYFEKVFEGVHSSDMDRRDYAQIHIKLINDIYNRFRKALESREILPAYESIGYEMEETKYPLEELILFLKNSESCYLNEKSAYIFTCF